jgi:hypothetical protein
MIRRIAGTPTLVMGLRRSESPVTPWHLLREMLAKSGKVGVAQFVLSNRESLCVPKAHGNALTLNTLRSPQKFGLWTSSACRLTKG